MKRIGRLLPWTAGVFVASLTRAVLAQVPAPPPEPAPPATEPPTSAELPPPTTETPSVAADPPLPAPAPAVAPPLGAEVTPAPLPAAPEKEKKKKKFPFQIESEDGEHELALRGLLHLDGRFFLKGEGTDTFLARRVRPILSGKVFRFVEFLMQAELANSRLGLLDVWGNLHFIDEVQFRIGKGKPPVGLEQLQSPAETTFAESAFPSLIIPNRDVGVQLHGKVMKGVVDWAAGVYNGVPDGGNGDVDENNEKDVVGRVFVQPFLTSEMPLLSGLGFGISATRGTQRGTLPQHRTAGQETFFAYSDGVTADGERVLFSPQGHWYVGPVGVMGEYVRSRQDVTDGAKSGEVTSTAWQLAASVVVYGGKPSYKGVQVDRPIDPENGSLGAIEVGARVSRIQIKHALPEGFGDPNESANRASSWAGLVSWHFATGVRAMVNYEHTSFYLGGPDLSARKSEGVLISRLQVGF